MGQQILTENGIINISLSLPATYITKAQNPSFSEKPQALIDLLDTILFTHNPTWDDCQQLLQALFTAEKREQILSEARKHVPGVDGRLIMQPHLVEEGFPFHAAELGL